MQLIHGGPKNAPSSVSYNSNFPAPIFTKSCKLEAKDLNTLYKRYVIVLLLLRHSMELSVDGAL